MRIGYLLKKFPRLSETFVLGEILRQEALGIEVVVLSRRAADDETRHPAFDDLKAPIHMVGADGLDPWRELFADTVSGAHTFELLGAAVKPLIAAQTPRVPKLVAEALWVLRACTEQGLHHLHVHFATESAIVAWIVHALGGPTYSLTAHAKDIYRSSVDPALLSRLVAGSEFTVTVCDANVEYLNGVLDEAARRQVRRLYNGIDLVEFRLAKDARENALILGAGRLVEKKGFDVLLEALAILHGNGRRFRAALIGEGDQRERLEADAGRLGLAEIVTFTGALDQSQVKQWMNRATVFCLPCRVGSDGNRDALPTVLLEGLAVGLPLISTHVTGIPEILAGGDCGRLVQPDDAEAFSVAIATLLDDTDERNRLALDGRDRAEDLFDGSSAARTLRDWFHAAVHAGAKT